MEELAVSQSSLQVLAKVKNEPGAANGSPPSCISRLLALLTSVLVARPHKYSAGRYVKNRPSRIARPGQLMLGRDASQDFRPVPAHPNPPSCAAKQSRIHFYLRVPLERASEVRGQGKWPPPSGAGSNVCVRDDTRKGIPGEEIHTYS